MTAEGQKILDSAVKLGFISQEIATTCAQKVQQLNSQGKQTSVEQILLSEKHVEASQLSTIKESFQQESVKTLDGFVIPKEVADSFDNIDDEEEDLDAYSPIGKIIYKIKKIFSGSKTK